MFEYVAIKEGSFGSIWGPCTDGTKLNCDCLQCLHANKLEEMGLDWDEEYAKAAKTGFENPNYIDA